MAHEEWRDVVGYEGYYQVSNLGRVRSLDRTVTRNDGTVQNIKGKVLRPSCLRSGYLTVHLNRDAKSKAVQVHQLVADAFLPPKEDSLIYVHANGILHDNRPENLKTVSWSERLATKGRHRDLTQKYSPESIEQDDIPNEHWKPVVGYDQLYEVSDLGRVRSVDRVVVNRNGIARTIHGMLLAQKLTNAGYFMVTLYANNKSKCVNVHRLVASAFLTEVDGKDVVDHINGNKADNRACNLRYATMKENTQYAIGLGLTKSRACGAKPVIRSDGKRFSSISAAAEETGVSQTLVSMVVHGKKAKCNGYTFVFADTNSEEHIE